MTTPAAHLKLEPTYLDAFHFASYLISQFILIFSLNVY